MRRITLRVMLSLLCAAAMLVPAAGANAFPTGSEVLIYPGNDYGLNFNAQGCLVDTHVILYPYTAECGNSKNEVWSFHKLEDGYDDVYATYGTGGTECLNVAGGNYALRTQIYAWQCNPEAPTSNEEFRKPERTKSPIGDDWLVPGRQPHTEEFCLNAQGGVHERADIVLWYCEGVENEVWWF
jgi:hypothetical protein